MRRNTTEEEQYNERLALDVKRQEKRHQQHRGSIYVSREPLKDDDKWHGAAPRPIEQRTWRPKDIAF